MRFYSPNSQNKMYNQSHTQLNSTTKSLKALFDEYLFECEYSKQLRSQTLKSYKEVFTTFQKIMNEIREVENLYPQMMADFNKRLSIRKRFVGTKFIHTGVKISTIKTYHNKLMAFFRWLENNNYLQEGSLSSKIQKPPNPKYEDERALSDNDISKIIATISLHTIGDVFTYKRDLLIINLFIYTGIRKGELLSLKIQDINFEERSIFINGKTSKSKKGRYIPLHPLLIIQLKAYLNDRKLNRSHCNALIISTKRYTPLTHYGLKHWVRRYRELSGVQFHVHQMRHTFACSLAKVNADISTIMKTLGHSSIYMTQQYLRSINSEHARNYIEQLSF